ncbi:MAG: aminotransferase class V-fold PLP-dependent enzyme [Acidocella sp.]|nr:aminotransferase class V-fold PLP-dependent enzyme [Acidocella sp.]
MSLRKPGRHFFANPGPTNIPDSVLRAMNRPSMDFMDADFIEVFDEARAGLKSLLFTEHEVFISAASGHGAWESAMVNLFSPGDEVLIIGGGFFSVTWAALARSFGIIVELFEVDWRHGVEIASLQARLAADHGQRVKAICIVHNESLTSLVTPIPEVRAALDQAGHPALLLVDTISSLGCFEFRMDEWGVDAVVGGSQKGLMLPTGLGFVAAGPRALAAHKTATLPRFYFDWTAMMERRFRSFTGTVPIMPFFGMVEALSLLKAEGFEAVWARHHRLAQAVRAAVRAWGSGNQGPELYNLNPARYSDSVTTVLVPDGIDADAFRKLLLDRFNVSIGGGLAPLIGKVFRIGHMGDLNEPMILGTLAAIELAFGVFGMPHTPGGVAAAIESLKA